MDMILRKLDHYKTRYIEHYKAIAFAQKKKDEIQRQIQEFVEINHKYGPANFTFLEEIAELVIRARRALTYTYPLRFFLEGGAKQRFFDFIQGDLEASLEKLNKKNEIDWQLFVKTDA